MNTRILSVIFLIIMGVEFLSCKGKDESPPKSQYDAGFEAGTKFREAFETYNNSEGLTKVTAGATLLSSHKTYKTKSENAEWKDGFLDGAIKADEMADNTKSKLMNLLDSSGVNDCLELVAILTELFSGSKE